MGVVVLSEGYPPQVVALELKGVPQGVHYAFGVDSAVPPISTTLTITVHENAPAGSYMLILTATSGNITKNYAIELMILEYEKPWYTQLLVYAVLVIAAIAITALYIKLRRRY